LPGATTQLSGSPSGYSSPSSRYLPEKKMARRGRKQPRHRHQSNRFRALQRKIKIVFFALKITPVCVRKNFVSVHQTKIANYTIHSKKHILLSIAESSFFKHYANMASAAKSC